MPFDSTSRTKAAILTCWEISTESLQSLEHNSFIDEKTDILTAHNRKKHTVKKHVDDVNRVGNL